MNAVALAPVVEAMIRPETHHGVPVLRVHVGDPIPNPRAPQRYAVLVNPDLARYWLSLNHAENRHKKPSAIRKYTRDMANGRWGFTPESLIFSTSGILQNGQNRLWAITEAGTAVWLMVDFGWPDDVIQQIDRGSARTNADALVVEGTLNSRMLAGAVAVASRYTATVGTPLRWGQTFTSSEVLEAYRDESDAWLAAIVIGRRVYDATRGLGPSTWIAAAHVIASVNGQAKTEAFFNELVDESGAAGSATRRLKSHYLRRRLSDSVSGDPREPLENIIRAFNAWTTGKPVGFVRIGGAFVLSTVRKA